MPDLNDDPLDRDLEASQVTAGRTERQQAIAASITETIIKNALREHGLTITRRR